MQAVPHSQELCTAACAAAAASAVQGSGVRGGQSHLAAASSLRRCDREHSNSAAVGLRAGSWIPSTTTLRCDSGLYAIELALHRTAAASNV